MIFAFSIAMQVPVALIVSLVVPFMLWSTPSLQQLRSLYRSAANNERSCNELLRVTEGNKSPLVVGYRASGMMIAAKYKFSPVTKMRAFKSGKAMMEMAIRTDTANIELRLLRYNIQANAPRFLGYHDNIRQDRAYILRKLPEIQDKELVEMIRSDVK